MKASASSAGYTAFEVQHAVLKCAAPFETGINLLANVLELWFSLY